MRFLYIAKQGPHKTQQGVVEADSQDQAVARIMEWGLIPLEVQEESAPGKQTKADKGNRFLSFLPRKISQSQVSLFTRQVSDLLAAGIPLLQALQIVKRQIRHPRFQECMTTMAHTVQDGGAFSFALEQYPEVFSGLYVNMVRSGEMAGTLAMVLDRLAGFLEQDQETRSRIQSSLLYPALLLAAGAVTVFVLLTWVIPNITAIFDDMNQSLPWPTLLLVSVSGFLARFWPVLMMVLGVAVFYLKRIWETEQGRKWFDSLALRVPGVGTFLLETQIGQFARTLGTLLESGVDIVLALKAVSQVVDNRLIREGLEQVSERVTQGDGLTEAVAAESIFPELVASMIFVGEQTGKPHQGLHKLADYYERQTELVMKRVMSLLEPVLILGLGLVVCFIVIAMLMPIFQMNMIIQ